MVLFAIICLGTLCLFAFLAWKWIKNPISRPKRPKIDARKDTVILHQLTRGTNAPSLSPFPLKLETFLRMAKIPYVSENGMPMSSKGKTPWMEYNGETVADSQFCIEFLKKKLNCDYNTSLSDQEIAVARAVRALTEENLYWVLVFQRWIATDKMVDKFLMHVKKMTLSPLILKIMNIKLRIQLWGHGIGRHTPDEINSIGNADLDALSKILGNKPYIMGTEPTEIDCAVFGMMAQVRWHMPDTKVEQHMLEELSNLVSYCDRMRDRFWPDWNERISTSTEYKEDHGALYDSDYVQNYKRPSS